MKVKDLFHIKYGVNLELNKLDITDDSSGINFVARTSQNNGVVAKVKPLPDVEPNPAGTISCAGGGSVLSTFVQQEPYYSGRDLYVLSPIKEMSFVRKLYCAHLISENKYKYSYGRQANKTLGDILLPESIPDWVDNLDLNRFFNEIKTTVVKPDLPINVSLWKEFPMKDIFNFSKGKRLTKEDMVEGDLNFIGAISDNNGVRQLIENKPTHRGNCITVNYNGSVGEAFYQKNDFWASDDVNVLTLKNKELNIFLGVFLCTIIRTNKLKFGYGRKWTLEKMKDTFIRLPVDINNNPDWDYMESYISSLPYSDRIQ
ncbi:restriction endonuclease subunit S [Citrobacter sp. Cpo071]|uniref:restriction endonuclease subunit S n=1 Tax=Citrobacter sp. Cpo071 TaxID=2985133 RepID=UPI00257905FD|nr:restriction endonuclease subunit S [Citrobacter sp. Cpo071]MDM2859068.1 restriction endonuclease subunit S [Citrobacter sp. Cpo071]